MKDLLENQERMALATEQSKWASGCEILSRRGLGSHHVAGVVRLQESERLDLHKIFQRMHPEDRRGGEQTLARAIGGGACTKMNTA